jgi:CRP-like cAMP-binding protein
MNSIQNWLKDYTNVTDEEFHAINDMTERISFKANEYLIKQGEISDKIGLLIQGVTRVSVTDPKGNEKITRFIFDGEPSIAVDSFFNDVPCFFSSVAIEPCTVIWTDNKRFNEFIQRFPKYNTIIITALTTWMTKDKESNRYLHLVTSKEKYDLMCELHPKIIERVPLKYIASYLGITQYTLSRIRAKK